MTLQGGMMQIAERVGRAKAAEIVFLSEPATAEQMRQWNVVNWVVDDAEFESQAAALATRLAEGPTKAFAATKALWRMQAEEGVKTQGEALRPLDAAFRDRGCADSPAQCRRGDQCGQAVPHGKFCRQVNPVA